LSCWGANSYFWASSASVDRSFNNSKTTLVLNFGVNFLLVVITVNLRINCNLIYCPLFWGMLNWVIIFIVLLSICCTNPVLLRIFLCLCSLFLLHVQFG